MRRLVSPSPNLQLPRSPAPLVIGPLCIIQSGPSSNTMRLFAGRTLAQSLCWCVQT